MIPGRTPFNSGGKGAILGGSSSMLGPCAVQVLARPQVFGSRGCRVRLVGNPGLDCTEEDFLCFPETS